MKMMGMKGWVQWASWYFKFSVFMLIATAILTFVFHINVGGGRVILTYSDPSVTFVFVLLYSLSLMTLCFVITTLFSKGMLYAFSRWVGVRTKPALCSMIMEMITFNIISVICCLNLFVNYLLAMVLRLTFAFVMVFPWETHGSQ